MERPNPEAPARPRSSFADIKKIFKPPGQTPSKGIRRSTTSTIPIVIARNLILDAIRQLKNPKGSPFADIRKIVSSKTGLNDAEDLKKLKMALKDAVDRDVLTKVDGKYKIKEMARKKTEMRDATDLKKLKTDAVDTGDITKVDEKCEKKTVKRTLPKSKSSESASGAPKRKARSKKHSAEQKTKKRLPSRRKRTSEKSHS